MRRDRIVHRLATAVFLAAAGFALGACENLADMIPDSKKPLPGERKLLFPEGVPGVTQGVPPELVRGNQQVQGQPGMPADVQGQPGQQAQQPSQEQVAEEPKPKPKPRVQRTVRRPAPPPEEAQDEPVQPQPQQASPWPAPQSAQPQASPWPSAPAPGTFSR